MRRHLSAPRLYRGLCRTENRDRSASGDCDREINAPVFCLEDGLGRVLCYSGISCRAPSGSGLLQSWRRMSGLRRWSCASDPRPKGVSVACHPFGRPAFAGLRQTGTGFLPGGGLKCGGPHAGPAGPCGGQPGVPWPVEASGPSGRQCLRSAPGPKRPASLSRRRPGLYLSMPRQQCRPGPGHRPVPLW